MRLILFLFLILTPVAATARTCDVPPRVLSNTVQYLEALDTIECLLLEINDLKRGQTALAGEIERLKRQIADVPGEYRNQDGKISMPGSGKINTASFRLTSQQGGRPVSLAIDHKVLETLCATGTGCAVSLFLEGDGLRLSETAATAASGPCALNYNKGSGAWSLGAGCDGSGVVSGTDGNAEPGGSGGGEVVMSAGGACILADAEASRAVGGTAILGADGSRGFYVVGDPGTATDGRFRCVLTID